MFNELMILILRPATLALLVGFVIGLVGAAAMARAGQDDAPRLPAITISL